MRRPRQQVREGWPSGLGSALRTTPSTQPRVIGAGRFGRVRWSYAAMLVVFMIVFSVTSVTSAVHPDAVEPVAAQPCIPLVDITCVPDLPGPGDVLDPVLDPVIDALTGAVSNMLQGSMDAMAGQMIIAAMASLDFMWTAITVSTSPNLDSVQGLFDIFRGVGIGLMSIMFIAEMWGAVPRRDQHRIFEAVWRVAVAGAGMGATRWLMDLLIPAVDALAKAIVFGANDDIETWLIGLGGPLLGAVGLVAWPILMIAGLIFFAGAIGIDVILIGAMFGYLGLYVMSPVLWAFTIHPATRSIANRAARKFFALLMLKVAIATGIALVASVLAFSTVTDDPVVAVTSLMIGGVGFIALWATPKALFDIFGLDVGATIAQAKELGSAATKPAELAVATAGAAVGYASFSSFMSSQVAQASRNGSSGSRSGGGGASGGSPGSGGGGGGSDLGPLPPDAPVDNSHLSDRGLPPAPDDPTTGRPHVRRGGADATPEAVSRPGQNHGRPSLRDQHAVGVADDASRPGIGGRPPRERPQRRADTAIHPSRGSRGVPPADRSAAAALDFSVHEPLRDAARNDPVEIDSTNGSEPPVKKDRDGRP